MTSGPLRVLLVGYGRMGQLVASLAPEFGVDVAGRITSSNAGDPAAWPDADVAIDFSTAAAVPANVRALASRGTSIVLGTTGWSEHEAALRREVAGRDVGIIAAPNFAVGVHLFMAVVDCAARLAAGREFAPWIHEAHHAAKKDAPSGTAVALRRVIEHAGMRVDVASTRAGFIPGTHTAGFESAAESITLTHTARDRTPFARGALTAAAWIHGRRGWFSMTDMLER